MLASEIARNVIYKTVKKLYHGELSEHQKEYLADNEIVSIVNKLYKAQREIVEQKIRSKIDKKMDEDDKPSQEAIDELIEDLFDDEELAKNRVRLEIQMYQKCLRKKRHVAQD